MKLELQNKGDGPRIAQCYIGAKVSCGLTDFVTKRVSHYTDTPLIGFEYNHFMVHFGSSADGVDTITIDTEANQPCIFACMKQELDIQVFWKSPKGNLWYDQYPLSEYVFRKTLLEDFSLGNEIKSIRILDLEGREGVRVLE